MQKLITILCCVVSFVNASAPLEFIPYLDQEKAKEKLIFTDGVSFSEVEKKLKKQYPHMPAIVLVEEYLGQENMNNLANKIPAPFYGSNGVRFTVQTKNDIETDIEHDGTIKLTLEEKTLPHVILANAEFKQLDSHGAQWLLTHETGHAKYPYIISNIDTSSLPVLLSTAYFWKKMINTQKPYKNKFTKFGSKCIAATIINNIYVRLAHNLEERRADNYANNYSNKTEIEGGINAFKIVKPHMQELWNSYKVSKVLPFCIGQYFLNPLHPSIDSRIRKLKKAAESKE